MDRRPAGRPSVPDGTEDQQSRRLTVERHVLTGPTEGGERLPIRACDTASKQTKGGFESSHPHDAQTQTERSRGTLTSSQ